MICVSKEPTEKKEKIYSIRFEAEELKALKEWVKENSSGKPLSKFIREAIEEKKQRIINPPKVNGNGLPISFKVFAEQQERKMEKFIEKFNHLNSDVLRRNGLLDIIKQRTGEIAQRQDYSQEIEQLVKIYNQEIPNKYRAYLTAQELITISKFPRALVMQVLQHSGRFKIKDRGWTLV